MNNLIPMDIEYADWDELSLSQRCDALAAARLDGEEDAHHRGGPWKSLWPAGDPRQDAYEAASQSVRA